jgi:hypothetical protein
MAFLTTLLPLGLGSDLLFGDMMSDPLRLITAAMTAVPFGLLVLRWRAAANWDNRHRIWLIGGILFSHTAFMMPGSPTAVVIGSLTIVAQVALLTILAKHVSPREKHAEPDPGVIRAGVVPREHQGMPLNMTANGGGDKKNPPAPGSMPFI